MNEIKQLITPEWGGEPYLREVWSILEEHEKQNIMQRVNDLFRNGLPFELEHDKILYAQLFSMLSFFEIGALQVNFKFLSLCNEKAHKYEMREHLIDEVVHSLIFAKLAFQLSQPYHLPPEFDSSANNLCTFYASQKDPAVGFILEAVIGEIFIEATFLKLKQYGIAPAVFDVIIEDEQKHVSYAKMYESFGAPDKKELIFQLEIFEEIILSTLVSQDQFSFALINLIGLDGFLELVNTFKQSYAEQLAILGVQTKGNLDFAQKITQYLCANQLKQITQQKKLPLSPTRNLFLSVWDEPRDPTISGMFSINITDIAFFEKKYPSELINCLMLQALSKSMADNSEFRRIMRHHEMIQLDQLDIALAVHLPNCGDQLASIKFENCHLMEVREISEHIFRAIELMSFCYQTTQELLKKHPYLNKQYQDKCYQQQNAVFSRIRMGQPFHTLSNVGYWGYDYVVSPLFPGEVAKYTLGKIERKQVWNNDIKQFEIQDILPVGLSVDHRVYDANFHFPKIINENFKLMLEQFLASLKSSYKPKSSLITLPQFTKATKELLNKDLELGYTLLQALSFVMDATMTIPQLLLEPEKIRTEAADL